MKNNSNFVASLKTYSNDKNRNKSISLHDSEVGNNSGVEYDVETSCGDSFFINFQNVL